MEVRLLKKSVIKTEEFYNDFLEGNIELKDEYFDGDKVVYIDEAPDFPIYMAIKDVEERNKLFKEAFDIISKYYIKTDRDIHFDEMFWYSLFCTKKREYLLETYPQISESIDKFQNVVLKKFDWENYVYKCIMAAEYITDATDDKTEQDRYFDIILNNLDLYNYILKSEIFRNGKFLINVLDIIDEDERLSPILKAKIKDRPDLGKDERYGRRVIFELNKSYPIIMSPTMEKDELKELFMKYLGYYYDLSKL